MKKLNIEMVNDLVCSWCPIGYRHMQTAINNLAIDVDFSFLPFEINPQMSSTGQTIDDYFLHHLSWSRQKLKGYKASVVNTAKRAGVDINYTNRTMYFNSKNAHKLMLWAKEHNEHIALYEVFIDAYFSQGADISDVEMLTKLVQQTSLDSSQVNDILLMPQFENQFRMAKQRVNILAVDTVPAFFINKVALASNIKSVVGFEKALIDALKN